MDVVQAARKKPLSQTAVRLEPAEAPGVYVVDEPEAHLHPSAIASVRTWLEELARTATTVLAATHSSMLLNTDSSLATQVLVLHRDGGTELRAVGTMDDALTETAGELGITKGDLLLMTRLVLFVEGLHDMIILSEWFGNEPGLVGNEIIGALGMRMAILMDKSPTRAEPTANRMLREGEQAGRDVTAVTLIRRTSFST